MTPRKSAFVWRLVIPVAIAVLPLSLVAQSGATQLSPDYVLKQESYQTPAKELADAVLTPRYLNVSLANASPDKKWFLNEIGDGPVVMKTFSKPFHELGGLFIDFKANRARPLTVRTPFFKAGIAGDGAYNRTLTPLGFQSERRDLWEAPNVYLSMSPFLYANNMTGALLMYHNLGDQNVGTDPTNSRRLYHALNGLGKQTALYLYPLEDHGPVAKETLLDLWARWDAWLDKYVKNPPKPDSAKKITTDQPMMVR